MFSLCRCKNEAPSTFESCLTLGYSNCSKLSVHKSHHTCGIGVSFYFYPFQQHSVELKYHENVWDMKANLEWVWIHSFLLFVFQLFSRKNCLSFIIRLSIFCVINCVMFLTRFEITQCPFLLSWLRPYILFYFFCRNGSYRNLSLMHWNVFFFSNRLFLFCLFCIIR